MAIIGCPECGRQVSEIAPSCPGCGAPVAALVAATAKTNVPTSVTSTPIQAVLEPKGAYLAGTARCPNCGSTNIQKCSVVHAAGITQTLQSSAMVGVGTSGGSSAIGVAKGASKGVHQTELSKMLAPPTAEQVPLTTEQGATAGVVFAAFGLALFFAQWWICGWILLGIAVMCLAISKPKDVVEAIKNSNAHNQARWESEYFCHACGRRFNEEIQLAVSGGGESVSVTS